MNQVQYLLIQRLTVCISVLSSSILINDNIGKLSVDSIREIIQYLVDEGSLSQF